MHPGKTGQAAQPRDLLPAFPPTSDPFPFGLRSPGIGSSCCGRELYSPVRLATSQRFDDLDGRLEQANLRRTMSFCTTIGVQMPMSEMFVNHFGNIRHSGGEFGVAIDGVVGLCQECCDGIAINALYRTPRADTNGVPA
jgi:hypothetical protein